jgi:hypothetical protein
MRKLLILLAVVPFIFAFSAPAAAEVNLSGYIDFHSYWQKTDNPAPAYDATDLRWEIDKACTGLSVSFKEGPVSGLVEIKPEVADYAGDGLLKHWWGSWNFGAGTLSVGQFWSPDFSCISSVKFGCGEATGPAGDPGCSARVEMVQLQFGGLQIAAAQVQTAQGPGETAYDAIFVDQETTLPKLIVAYRLNVAMLSLKFFGGYQTFDQVTATDTKYSVDSYVLGVTATAGFGPLTLKGHIWGAQNVLEYTNFPPPQGFNAYYDATTNSIKDADYMAYGINVAYKVSDTLELTAGYLTGKSELDRPGTWEDEAATYHVNATFTMAKGVSVSPEYVVTDSKDIVQNGVKTEQAKVSRYGVLWKIAF